MVLAERSHFTPDISNKATVGVLGKCQDMLGGVVLQAGSLLSYTQHVALRIAKGVLQHI